MLDAKEIDIEIARLEYMESSYPNYAKLADLYAIRNEMNRMEDGPSPEAVRFGNMTRDITIGNYGDSDFLGAVAGGDAESIWLILDDLMDTLRVAQPRAYNSVMRKIRAISDNDRY